MAFDPTWNFAYVVNRGSGSISQFHLNKADGNLTPLSTPVVSDPGQPWQILVDPSGELAYVSNESSNSVTIYSIGPDGALTNYSSAPTGAVPGGIGIAIKR